MNPMTEGQLKRMLALTIDVACAPPKRRQQKWVVSAQVPWDYIEEMRSLLDEVGIDWRKYVAQDRRIRAPR